MATSPTGGTIAPSSSVVAGGAAVHLEPWLFLREHPRVSVFLSGCVGFMITVCH